ncbi:uncharacterized protein BDZ99DRAFT_565964 [Mytilinidion resinicola]|uniref:FAD/NAD(P)-binding domain-containing protein n=1 Tax=Mytilinidion resinicola TaxID=574789 RepID=A0A6A6Z5Z9_9PEZI|nr:uncharacterized protein BDZ99DRAFT_565964 [Mytilinidion resinicola]KAF2816093.1 hypothetical protein BDZ99DRAFT_565964 [Mytilinidion resinicola]
MATRLPAYVDTVIIGGGPAALILSFILHGNTPYYVGGHHDTILDSKLSARPSLLDLTPELYAHFSSSLRYSTQALPINTLLDTLIRPNADTEINPTSCIEWRNDPGRAISHIALGDAAQAGGQWADNPVSASWNIGTLSYAEMLSLPGFSYSDYYAETRKEAIPDFIRPSRADVADYYKAYPAAVGILDSIRTSTIVGHVSRTSHGFYIASHGISCRHLVLASGIFTVNIPPPKLLAPLAELLNSCDPLLVIGSGFSAADVILSTPPNRQIIHIFQWIPNQRPSPLRGCHHTAYPEYATIYRQMKLAVMAGRKKAPSKSPLMRQKLNPFFNSRDWATYRGLPNAMIVDVTNDNGRYVVKIKLESGDILETPIGHLEYVVGRRGSLAYLDQALQDEVLEPNPSDSESNAAGLISAHTLRAKAETDLEVAPNVFIIGSLAGDSLVRHAVGGCVYAASKIMDIASSSISCSSRTGTTTPVGAASPISKTGSPLRANCNTHQDLHLDRRKLKRSVDIASAENKV